MNRSWFLNILVLVLAASSPALAQEVGPSKGSLVIVGGTLRDMAIVDRFIELAGGPEAPIVVVPTAGGAGDYDDSYSGLRQFRSRGAKNLTVLHTTDSEVANTEEFVRPLREARGVWFVGGRQWRLADAYLGTKTEEEFHAVLERGGVIGGSSAGATIQGTYLVRGDTRTNRIVMGDHEEGFGFLKNSAIDQHLLRRNRQFDLIEVIETYPELLGIGIDENTAIVVQGDQFEVIGESVVAIYDFNSMVGDDGRFYFLTAGDRFDLANRRAFRGSGSRPLDGPVRQTWPLAHTGKSP